jgi:hypothetical protein
MLKRIAFGLVSIGVLIGLSGCLSLPHSPKAKVVQQIELPQQFVSHLSTSDAQALELYHVGKIDARQPARNMIFVALDRTFQAYFDNDLKKIYHTQNEVRIEDLAWDVFAPELVGVYGQVLRISYNGFNGGTLQAALDYMEAQHQGYDLFLLTHGIPNNIMTTPGSPLLSWQEIDGWKGRYPSLDLVFLQSCYGSTLAPDWIQTGAKAVLSYPGLNRNFFYPMTLFKELKKVSSNDDAVTGVARATIAFDLSNQSVQSDIEKSGLDRFMINGLGMSVQDYLQSAPSPQLDHE